MNILDRVIAVERRISALDTDVASLSSFSAGHDPVDFERTLQSLERAPSTHISNSAINRIIENNSARWGVDKNLVRAIIENESGFNMDATSEAGAQGLMQLMPDTAASLGVTNPYDPEQNIAAGTRYLRSLLNRFNGNLRLAVAAYNAGPNAVARYDGVPPFPETHKYVMRVLASYAELESPSESAL